MGPHDGRVEQHPVQVRCLHRHKQAGPHAFLRPAPAALAHGVVLTEARRQRPPGAPVAGDSKHRIEKEAIILAAATYVAHFASQVGCQGSPSRITQFV